MCLRCSAAPSLNDPMVVLVRGLGTRLEAVSGRLEQQQRLLGQLEGQHGSARRQLAAALAVLAAVAVANLVIALSASPCKSQLRSFRVTCGHVNARLLRY